MKFKNNKASGWVITLIFIALGIYVGYRNHKKEGFWYGVLALFLLTTYVFVDSENGTEKFNSGPFSIETNPK